MLTVLLDENIDGFKPLLSRILFSPAWGEIASALEVRLASFGDVGLAKGSTDETVWEFCQREQVYLLTDNRNENKANSLAAMIRERTLPHSLPVFTISEMARFKSERNYGEQLVAKLLEYFLDLENLLGTGRLYLP